MRSGSRVFKISVSLQLESALSLIPVRQDTVTYKGMVSTSFQAYTSVVNSLAPDSAIRRATAAAGRSGIAPDRLLMGMFFTLWLLGMFIILAAACAAFCACKKERPKLLNSWQKRKDRRRFTGQRRWKHPFCWDFSIQ